jgi:hypothetical protein
MAINQAGLRMDVLLALAILGLSTSGCNLPFGRQDPASRIAELEAELQAARAEATAEAAGGEAGEQQAAAPSVLEEPFDGDASIFQLGEGAVIQDGGLLLGPYPECANDVANFDQPVGCLVVCQGCDRNLSDYELRVGFTFEDGLSDREFGVILRLVDEDLDSLLDREDYLLAIGFNVFDNHWRVYLHEPGELDPWREITSGLAGFLQPGRLNELEVTTTNGGQLMVIALNGNPLETLTGGAAEPGQIVVSPWMDSGAVGLIGLGRGVQARFDNFALSAAP